MIIEGNTIIADEGKVLRRKADQEIVGGSYVLGYIYYIGGKKLPEPKLEVPSDFEEITIESVYDSLVVKYIRERYSIDDELAIQRQRDEKKDAFKEYYDFCESCKERARQELSM